MNMCVDVITQFKHNKTRFFDIIDNRAFIDYISKKFSS